MSSKTLLLASSALAALALATPAEARSPYYFTAGGGANWIQDDSFRAVTSPTFSADTLTFSPNSDVGFVLHAAVGAHLDEWVKGLRLEVEGSFRQSNVGGFWTSNVDSPVGKSSGGLDFDESVWAILGNVWWDIDLGSPFSPYIGGGMGWGESKLKGTYQNSFQPGGFDFSNDGFTWQVGAGVNWQIGPNVAIGVGYRYMSAPDVDVFPAGIVGFGNSAQGNVNVDSQSVLLDFTFAL